MKKLLLILLCVPLIGFGQNTINEGQIINIFAIEKITSKNTSIGDVFMFAVYEDVLSIEGKVLIEKFTLIYATISKVKKAKTLGRKGDLSLTINYVTAVDGTPVKVTSHIGKSGNSRGLVAYAGGAWLVVPLILKGTQAKIKAGTISSLEVKERTIINGKDIVQDYTILIDKLTNNMNVSLEARSYIKSLAEKDEITHIQVSNLCFRSLEGKIRTKDQVDFLITNPEGDFLISRIERLEKILENK